MWTFLLVFPLLGGGPTYFFHAFGSVAEEFERGMYILAHLKGRAENLSLLGVLKFIRITVDLIMFPEPVVAAALSQMGHGTTPVTLNFFYGTTVSIMNFGKELDLITTPPLIRVETHWAIHFDPIVAHRSDRKTSFGAGAHWYAAAAA